ncbi:helix-turn-helix transcriptional regulator [uncultured Psychrobacillus sp.]|uniref:helix-turn-helix domain-containing protein n=1 Tax=uncultured Psychrobacillus sp. TaxID=1551585 RepID=UPI0026207D01|nr:helix-turn-helix transcriptional regulator [uncultured Psychrobacillus sp.]
MEELGRRLAHFRREKGMSMKELAENVCDYTTIYRVEKGKQLPRLEILNDICMKLEIPFQSLFPLNEEVEKIKKTCRELTYAEDYSSLETALEECNELLGRVDSIYTSIEFRKFILMHRAIILHKHENDPIRALQTLEPLVKLKNAVSEIDFGILNSMGLIYISLKDYENAHKIYKVIFNKIKNRNAIDDSTLFPRVGYNYALTMFKLKKFEVSLETIQEVLLYSQTRHLIYLLGETHYMLAILFKKKGLLKDSENEINNAILVFSLTKNHESLEKSKDFLLSL